MIKEFNTYIDGIPLEFWRDLCREELMGVKLGVKTKKA